MSASTQAKKPAERKTAKGSYFQVAKELGLIGCIDGPPDLALNPSKYLQKAVRAKHCSR